MDALDFNNRELNHGSIGQNKKKKNTKSDKMKLFPTDRKLSKLSFIKFGIYLGLLWFCKSLFEDYYRIPTTEIIIDADQLNESRKLNREGSSMYLEFQVANLEVILPQSSNQDDVYNTEGTLYVYSYSANKLLSDSIKSSFYIKNPEISPYWAAVCLAGFEDDDNSGNDIIFEFDFLSDDNSSNTYEELLLNYVYANYIVEYGSCDPYFPELAETEYYKTKEQIPQFYDFYSEILPEQLPIEYSNPFRFEISYHSLNSNDENEIIDKTWQKEIERDSIYEKKIKKYDWYNEYEKFYFYSVACSKDSIKYIGNKKYLTTESFASSYYFIDTILHELDPFYYEFNRVNDSIPFGAPRRKDNTTIGIPNLFDRYDISQGWYNLQLNSSTIDSLSLTINFIGATDFYPIAIEPDEIGSNYIKYTDQNKLLQIRIHGLSFYARFKEMDNKQTIRSFVVSTLLSGLLIIVLSYIINIIMSLFKRS